MEQLTIEDLSTNVETTKHIRKVQTLLRAIIYHLEIRAIEHDASKLQSPEVNTFTTYTPKLKNSEYMGDEYKQFLVEMGVALKHHYKHNRHHPEHYEKGVNDMSLIDLIEMLCDWKASSERHADGDIHKSIDANISRFTLSEQLACILKNTVPYIK